MAKLPVNEIEVVGNLKRMDIREGQTKDGREFVSATYTINVEGNEIRIENFAMKLKADSTETGAYKSINTLFTEAKALFKTIRHVGEDKGEEVQDETIVENIEDTSVLRFSNYNGFKYTRFACNEYMSNGELVKNTRIECAFPNRVEEGKDFKYKRDFEICSLVKTAPVVVEKNEVEFMQMTVIVPTYQEAYGDRPEKVTLQEIKLVCHDTSAWGYLEDNFEVGSVVYLNGQIIRTIEKVENEVEVDENRGFGRAIARQKSYTTNINDYLEILGGYVLETDEVEEMPEFSQELWEKAKAEQEQKEQEMKQEKPSEPSRTFGRSTTQSAPKKNNALPF